MIVLAGCWLPPAKCHMQQSTKTNFQLSDRDSNLNQFKMLLRKFHNEWKFVPEHCPIQVPPTRNIWIWKKKKKLPIHWQYIERDDMQEVKQNGRFLP